MCVVMLAFDKNYLLLFLKKNKKKNYKIFYFLFVVKIASQLEKNRVDITSVFPFLLRFVLSSCTTNLILNYIGRKFLTGQPNALNDLSSQSSRVMEKSKCKHLIQNLFYFWLYISINFCLNNKNFIFNNH